MTAPDDELERIIRCNINAPMIADARIQDLVAALQKYTEDRIVAELEMILAELPRNSNNEYTLIILGRIAEIKVKKYYREKS